MTPRKVLVVTFVDLVRDGGGPASAALGVAQALHARGRLAGLVCPAFAPDEVGLPIELIYSPPKPILQKLIRLATALLERSFGINERRLRERLFDFLVSRSQTLHKADAILFLKPAFPRTARRASEKGIPSFVWASILHPRFNQEAVLEQQRIWKVNGGEAYMDEERTQALETFFRTVDHILVGSELAQRSYLDYGQSKEEPSLLKGTFSVDCERFSPAQPDCENDGVFRVLHASHMNIIKGVGYLLDAWSHLQLDRAELLLAGTMEPELQKLYERLAPPSTQRLGYIRETPALYRRVNLFISPSVADMHPYTVLEAMASGLPVIVSNRCGLSTLIENGVEGFVYPYDNTEALAAHIRWCSEETDSLKKMGIAARKKAMQCDRSIFSKTVIAAMDQRIES